MTPIKGRSIESKSGYILIYTENLYANSEINVASNKFY